MTQLNREPYADAAAAKSRSAAAQVRKVTWVGLATNLVLSAFKFAAGVAGSSQSVVADAIHSASDGVTDVAILVGSHFWSEPADAGHPHGHGRIETLVATFVGGMILAAGIGTGWQAISAIREPQATVPGWIALVGAAVSIVCKEVLYRWTAEAGKRVKSAALSANAWHHRLDALSSIPVLLAVGGAIAIPGWMILDGVGAAFVSVLILQAGVRIIWAGLKEFVDVGASAAVRDQIKAIIHENQAVIQVHGLRTRYVSGNLHMDMHVVVDGSISVCEGHDIAEDIKRRLLREGPDVADVVVHIEPSEAALDQDALQ